MQGFIFQLSKSDLSRRQKLILLAYVAIGLILVGVEHFLKYTHFPVNTLIFQIGFLVPFLLLLFSFHELKNIKYYTVWLIIGIVQFYISLKSFNHSDFVIQSHLNEARLPDVSMSLSSTDTLKSLLIFLLFYQLVRKLYQFITTRDLMNVFFLREEQMLPESTDVNVLSIAFNIFLYIVTFVAAFFPLDYLLRA